MSCDSSVLTICHTVASVYSYPVPEGKSGQSVVEGLQQRIELLGAVRAGHFSVDCDIYQSVLQSSINGENSFCHSEGSKPQLQNKPFFVFATKFALVDGELEYASGDFK